MAERLGSSGRTIEGVPVAPLRFPSQKVMVIPLVERMLLQTDRTTTFSYQAVELDEAAQLGPHIESLRVLTVTKNRTANPTPPRTSPFSLLQGLRLWSSKNRTPAPSCGRERGRTGEAGRLVS